MLQIYNLSPCAKKRSYEVEKNIIKKTKTNAFQDLQSNNNLFQ